MSSALTGRKVPAPTCRVSVSRPIAARVERFEQPRREVQRRGRRGDGALLAREHRLVIGAVRLVGRALRGDVGRQRHPAGALEQQLDRLVPVEVQQRRAVLGLLDHRRRDALAEVDRVADARPLGVAQERLPFARPLALVQRRADARLAAPPFELGRDDLGVVEHQHVAGPQQLRQLEHLTVGDLAALDQQQPRAVARPRRPQRDPLRRKLEIEQVDAHRAARA